MFGLALDAGRTNEADWAVRQAISALPEFGSLYQSLLRAAAARGDAQVLDRVWRDARQALRDDPRALAAMEALHQDLQADITASPSHQP